MRYQRTQVYLEPQEHRRLLDEAHRRGMSLTALLREIVGDHVRETAPQYDAPSWDALFAVGEGAPAAPSDGDIDEYVAQAAEKTLKKKMGRA